MNDPGPPSPEQKEQFASASVGLRALQRPARVARVNAWAIAVFGVLTILWGSVSGGGWVVGAALLAVAWNEFRGVRLLRALDADGARILGWNQIVLGAVVVAYCATVIVSSYTTPDPAMAELEDLMGFSSAQVAQLTALFYGTIAVLVAIVQAVLARWHFKGGRRLQAFREDTAAWILDLLDDSRSPLR